MLKYDIILIIDFRLFEKIIIPVSGENNTIISTPKCISNTIEVVSIGKLVHIIQLCLLKEMNDKRQIRFYMFQYCLFFVI